MNTKVSKTIFKKLKQLGLIEQSATEFPTVYETRDIIAEKLQLYISEWPQPYMKWTAAAFALGEPHTNGRLLMFTGYKAGCKSRGEAVINAINDTLDQYIDARAAVDNMSEDELKEQERIFRGLYGSSEE